MDFSKYSLPKYRYNELKYYALQYGWYAYVVKAIDEGSYDITPYAKRFDFEEKDPTAAAGILRARCSGRIEAIANALDNAMVNFQKEHDYPTDALLTGKTCLFKSVTQEIGYFALGRRYDLTIEQSDFAELRRMFFYELNRETEVNY